MYNDNVVQWTHGFSKQLVFKHRPNLFLTDSEISTWAAAWPPPPPIVVIIVIILD